MSRDETRNLGSTPNLISAPKYLLNMPPKYPEAFTSRIDGFCDWLEVGNKRERGMEDAFQVPDLDH